MSVPELIMLAAVVMGLIGAIADLTRIDEAIFDAAPRSEPREEKR